MTTQQGNPNNLNQARHEAQRTVEKTASDLQKRHEETARRMDERLRLMTHTEQQRMEQAAMIRSYYPEYGKESGFKEGFLSTAAAGLAGLGTFKVSGGGWKGALASGAVGLASYAMTNAAVETAAATASSPGGLRHKRELEQYGPAAAYVARSDWATYQGYIPPADYFRTTVGTPSDIIADSWGLNKHQFLPGAMDLVSSGIVAPQSASPGRKMTDALKESAQIFKAIQSFFGSVDIAGLTQKIRELQMAGFTPEGMTDLGRAMQKSTLAFAPENIRNTIYEMIVQVGAGFSQQGLSATLGGQAALEGFESAFMHYGKLSDYERTVFRSREDLGKTLTGLYSTPMANPYLMMGRGDPLKGLEHISTTFDFTSLAGVREYRRTMHDVSANLTIEDQIATVDDGVENLMSMYGISREDAATYYFEDPDKAMAYMIQRKGRGEIMGRNIDAFGKARFSKSMDVDAVTAALTALGGGTSAQKMSAARMMVGSGAQGQALRHMIRTGAYDSQHVTYEEMTRGSYAGGYLDLRALGRMSKRATNASKEFIRDELVSGVTGTEDNMFQHYLRRGGDNAFRNAAEELEAYKRGYTTNEPTADEIEGMRLLSFDPRFQHLTARIEEFRKETGQNMTYKDIKDFAEQTGDERIIAAFGTEEDTGRTLKALEMADRSQAEKVTGTLTSLGSLGELTDLTSRLSTPVFTERKGANLLTRTGAMLQNPMMSAVVVAGATTMAVAGGILTAPVSVPLTIMGGVGLAVKGASLGLGLTQGLGSLLTAAGGIGGDSISKEAAQLLDRNAYGLEAVIMSLMALLPEEALTGLGGAGQWRPPERKEALIWVSTAVYQAVLSAYKADKNISDDDAFDTVLGNITSWLNDPALSRDNGFFKEYVVPFLTRNPERVRTVTRIVLEYLRSTTNPEETVVVKTRVEQKIGRSTTDFLSDDATIKAYHAYHRLIGDAGSAELLIGRAGTDAESWQTTKTVSENIHEALKKHVTAGGGQLNESQRLLALTAIQKKITSMTPEEKSDPAKVESAIEGMFKDIGMDMGPGGGKAFLASIRGASERKERSTELSKMVIDILKVIRDDDESKRAVKEILGGTIPTT